jgi:hypothetical protein
MSTKTICYIFLISYSHWKAGGPTGFLVALCDSGPPAAQGLSERA